MKIRRALVAAAACAVAAACAPSAGTPSNRPEPGGVEPPSPPVSAEDIEARGRAERQSSRTAIVEVRRIPAYRWPGAPRPLQVFRNPNEYGYPVVFLVKRDRGEWLEVYLPIRPNGVTGWVRSRDVRIEENPFRIVVDVSANRLTLRRADRVVMRERVAVGTNGTPTPIGLFYTRIEHRTGDPGGVYGPFIQVLSAFSEVHFTFNGGNGEVGIHGTNDPSGIGRAVSNGCIRMRNRAITRLTRIAPVGTPVRIVG